MAGPDARGRGTTVFPRARSPDIRAGSAGHPRPAGDPLSQAPHSAISTKKVGSAEPGCGQLINPALLNASCCYLAAPFRPKPADESLRCGPSRSPAHTPSHVAPSRKQDHNPSPMPPGYWSPLGLRSRARSRRGMNQHAPRPRRPYNRKTCGFPAPSPTKPAFGLEPKTSSLQVAHLQGNCRRYGLLSAVR